jgi:hypothetical protein
LPPGRLGTCVHLDHLRCLSIKLSNNSVVSINPIFTTTFRTTLVRHTALLHCWAISMMKTTAVLAIAGLASTVHAGVHTLKLNKVPLEQQLVSNSPHLLSATSDAYLFYRPRQTLANMLALCVRSTRRSSWVQARTSSDTLPSMRIRVLTTCPSRTS